MFLRKLGADSPAVRAPHCLRGLPSLLLGPAKVENRTRIVVCTRSINLGFSHKQGGVTFFDARVKILMPGRQI